MSTLKEDVSSAGCMAESTNMHDTYVCVYTYQTPPETISSRILVFGTSSNYFIPINSLVDVMINPLTASGTPFVNRHHFHSSEREADSQTESPLTVGGVTLPNSRNYPCVISFLTRAPNFSLFSTTCLPRTFPRDVSIIAAFVH